MPGKMIPWVRYDAPGNINVLKAHYNHTLIFSRDTQGVSWGTVFDDDGISADWNTTKNYEHYNLTLTANSTIQSVFRGNSTRRKVKVEEIIIADAEGLEDYDYACWTNKTGGPMIKLEA